MSEILPTVLPVAADADAGSWDNPPPRMSVPFTPVLTADGFEGPLNWLLEMVRAHKIDLAQISILALIESFAGAMNAALSRKVPTLELARWAAWTVMAAQLAELRSRLLLPADLPEAQEGHAEAEALRRQWIKRAEMVAAADWLARRPQLGWDVFARGRPETAWAGQGGAHTETEAAATDDDWMEADDPDRPALKEGDEFIELLRACLVALRLPSHGELYQPRLLPFWSVRDATERIVKLLPQQPESAGLEAFLPEVAGKGAGRRLHHRAALAATLVASLELARGGSVTLDQADAWGSISVH